MRSLISICKSIILVGIVVGASTRLVRAAEAPIPVRIKFNRDVRPILSDNCFHCHGPDKNARKAELRLDVREQALKATASGATPIVPSKTAESEVVRRINSTDTDEVMPPPE